MKLIVATDEEGGIGKEGKIPWDFPEDMQFFKMMTIGGAVLVGRKTFESLKIKRRHLFVLTSNGKPCVVDKDGYIVVHLDLNTLFSGRYDYWTPNLWVCGGSDVYNIMIEDNLVTEIYKTEIPGKYNCDRFFYVPNDFELIASMPLKSDGPQLIVRKYCKNV